MKNSMFCAAIAAGSLVLSACTDTKSVRRDFEKTDASIRAVDQTEAVEYPEVTGFYVPERLPAEDLEVPQLYADLILTMKNPRLPSNSREKYETIKKLLKKVDYTFTRETKTLNELFYYGDAIIDSPAAVDRTITFNYQYNNHYVRLIFYTYGIFVTGVEIIEK